MRRLILCIGALCAQAYPDYTTAGTVAGGRIIGQVSVISGELRCNNCTVHQGSAAVATPRAALAIAEPVDAAGA